MRKTEYIALAIIATLLLLSVSQYFNITNTLNQPFQQANNAFTKPSK